ncbi:MAG: ATP synthase subunit I [Mariprofundaceae bacterium]
MENELRHESANGWLAEARAVMVAQAVGGVVAAVVALWLQGVMIAMALLYGVVFSLLNGLWLAQRLMCAADLDVQTGTRLLYRSAAVRFVALIAALSVAHLLNLHLLAVAVGIVVAHLIMFGYSAALSNRRG